MKHYARTRITAVALTGAALSALGLVSWATAPAPLASHPVAYDYCVIVYPVYVDQTKVFGGGSYCVPLP